MLEHLAELRGEEAMLSEFPKEDLAKYLSPADLHVLEDPRESPSRFCLQPSFVNPTVGHLSYLIIFLKPGVSRNSHSREYQSPTPEN